MIPEKGQRVKCFMRTNSILLEGIVEEWTEEQVILKSLDEKTLAIIHRPTDDIVITTVILETMVEEINQPLPSKPVEKSEIASKLQNILQSTDNEDLNKMNIEQLKHLVKQQEIQIIEQKKKEHFGTPFAPKNTAKYSNHFLYKKK